MLRRTFIIISLFVSAILAVCAADNSASKSYVLEKANSFKINGDGRHYGVIDNLHNWTPPKYISFGKDSVFTGKWSGEKDLSGRAVMQADDDNLFFYIEIIDDNPMTGNPEDRWQQDCVELFLSLAPHPPDPDLSAGDIQIQLSPGNGKEIKPSAYVLEGDKKNKLNPEGCEIVAKEADLNIDGVVGCGYVMEAKIPWKLFPVYQKGKKEYITFAFYVSDLDNSGKFNKCIIGGTAASNASTKDYIAGFMYAPQAISTKRTEVGAPPVNVLVPERFLPPEMKSKNIKIWDDSLTVKRSLPGRESICLDGIWAVQTFSSTPPATLDSSKWKYMLTPWDARYFEANRGVPYFTEENSKLILSKWDALKEDSKDQRIRFHHREFLVPKSWEGKNIVLSVEECGLTVKCMYYVNGKLVSGEGYHKKMFFDISKYIIPGQTNSITIMVCATKKNIVPMEPIATYTGDIWIFASESKNVLKTCRVTTSVKNKDITFDFELSSQTVSDNISAKIEICDWKTGEKALEIKPETLESIKTANGSFKLKSSWPNPKLWSPEHPDLYKARIILEDSKGLALDSTEERFGFREVSISGKNLLLNGIPIHIKAMMLGYTEYDRKNLKHMKKLNFNTVVSFYNIVPKYCFNWLDEEGLMVIQQIHPYIGEANFSQYNMSPERKDWLKQYRNHPSVILWVANLNVIGNEAGWCHLNYHVTGTDYFPDKSKSGQDALSKNKDIKAWFQEAVDIPVIDYCSGNQAPVASVMSHQDFGIPLQEAPGLAENWSKKNSYMPFIALESWVGPTGYNLDLLRSSKFKNEAELLGYKDRESSDINIMTEELSQYLGDKAYEISAPVKCFPHKDGRPDATAFKGWDFSLDEVVSKAGNYYIWRPFSASEIAMKALAIRENARGDRGYGMTGRNYFDKNSELPDPIIHALGKNREKASSVTIDKWIQPLCEIKGMEDKMTSVNASFYQSEIPADIPYIEEAKTFKKPQHSYEEYYKDATRPVLAFIGGGPETENFRWKDHAFRTGEKVQKTIVAVNDLEKDIDLKVKWELLDNLGKEMAKGDFEKRIPAGGVLKTPISFIAPKVDKKMDFTISISAGDPKNNVSCADEFKLEFHPVLKKTDSTLKIYCYDEKGLTSSLLERLGIASDKVGSTQNFNGMPDNATLVIGRESLDGFLKIVKPEEFSAKINAGMRVLVMEQGLDSVLGPYMKEIRLRNQFMKMSGHPVTAGFKDSDFAQWRGESSLTPSHPQWDPASEYTEYNNHQMFGKWGNEGIVSTLPIRRPQHGNFRTLLAGGFDQEWAAIIEFHQGKGDIIFCQADVSGRSQNNPVAETLVLQTLKYLNAYNPPALGAAAFCGSGKTLEWIKRFNPELAGSPEKANLLLTDSNENAGVQKQWLEKYVKEDGKTMLVLWPGPNSDLKWISPDISVSLIKEHDNQFYKSVLTDADKKNKLFNGINTDDLFFRFRRPEMPLITKVPSGAQILAGGLFADIPCGKGRVIICQIDPSLHEGERSYAKIVRMFSNILTSFNVAQNYRPTFTAPGMELSQREWRFKTDPENIGGTQGWEKPGFDDSNWRGIKTGTGWESQGVTEENPRVQNPPNTPYNGTGWYRIKFDIPKEYLNTDLYFEAGSIAGEDEVWFNGVKIGETKKTEGVGNYYRKCPRNYKVPADAVKAGENAVAIKVNSPSGIGGISKNPVRITSMDKPYMTALTPMEKDRKTGDPYRFVMW
ncbi:MAG: hypothetical protein NT118_02140 [Lentisphaerae bacterium]|nr:hypothetical protein [Lentisphaerota bacterium]